MVKMKKQIRWGVFETNSSSTHAICISTNHDTNKLKLPDCASFARGEFGWECRKLKSVWEKASYLYEAVLGTYCDDDAKEKLNHIEKILNKYNIKCDFEPTSSEYWDGGYIDHVGEDDMLEWLECMLSDDDTLLTYLFGDAFVITGNDNSDEFRDVMYKSLGKVDTDYGTWTEYGDLKKEYNGYDIYYKGN